MILVSSSVVVGLTALGVAYAVFRSYNRSSLSMIRGPKSPSFIFGNLLELFQRPVGEADFAWQSQYGGVVRFKGILGETGLWITDPKALQKILNTSAYSYAKSPILHVASRVLHGKGIFSAEGDDHRRHKSIMLPAFGPAESKGHMPIFKDCAESVGMKWLEITGAGNGQSVVIDVLPWLSRGTLDAIGQAAFDVQFDSVRNDSHPLANKYKNYLGEVFGLTSAVEIFLQAFLTYIPVWISQYMLERSSSPRIAHVRDAKNVATNFAEELVREKSRAVLLGKDSKDVFTLLVKANMDANAKKRLSDEELIAQMHTMLLAGHESTATSISWVLLELARNPKIQSRLRDEIRKTEAAINTRGDSQLTIADLEDMPYLNAVIKEGLRFHPIAPENLRVACHDGVLPLSKPLLTKSGDVVNEIFVPKGTGIVISIAGYNRDKDIWGEDAHEFKPDRWLDGAMDNKKLPSVGVYSNLMTFQSGPRGCLGWRFAIVEMQAFLWELVGKFEFAMTDRTERLLRQPAMMMVPMVEGELERGPQMPLAVSLASQDDETF